MEKEKANESVINFAAEKSQLEALQSTFEETKKSFYNDMNKFFDENQDEWSDGKYSFVSNPSLDIEVQTRYQITRIVTSKLIWDVDKVKKALGKRFIKKKYEVINFDGLVSYLKAIGADPKDIKNFIVSDSSVDEDEINKAASFGEIDEADLKGLFKVKKGNPYYRIKAENKELKNNGEER